MKDEGVTFERYELKYWTPLDRLTRELQQLEPYLREDENSVTSGSTAGIGLTGCPPELPSLAEFEKRLEQQPRLEALRAKVKVTLPSPPWGRGSG